MLPTCRYHPDVSENIRNCIRCGLTYCPNCLVEINGQPHCSVCKNEQLLDIRSGVDRTKLVYAGIGKRFVAMLIDNLIVFVPLYILFFVLMFTAVQSANANEPPLWVFVMYIPMIGVPFVYEALMLQNKNGQTVGKMAMKVRVVRPDGSPLTTGQAWGRSGLRVVLNCLSIFNYIPAFFTAEKTTLHDLAASTRVIEAD